MKSLAALLAITKTRDYLARQSVFVDIDDFVSSLSPAARPAAFLKLSQTQSQAYVIWAGQQLYVDYRHSVISKLRLLNQLGQRINIVPFFIGADTDRSGSDKAITTIQWPLPGGSIGNIPVVKAKKAKYVESRFVPSDMAQRQEVIRILDVYLRQTIKNFQSNTSHFQQVKQLLLQKDLHTLADINLAITRLLIKYLGFSIPAFLLSQLVEQEALTANINHWLNRRSDCIAIFNETIAELERLEINPAVKRLPDDYLPINYSCAIDGSRFRLCYERQGNDHFAVGQSRAGKTYRFSLGQNQLNIAEIASTGRWSPDVCLPIFLNEQISGCVAGKSSALYGIVMNRVLEKALEQRPAPILVPDFSQAAPTTRHDSVLFDYLTA